MPAERSPLRWDDSHDGSPHQLGYRGQHLVGQVAWYDRVEGGGPGWRGYLIGRPVTGRCGSVEEARAGVERAATGLVLRA